MWLMKQKLLREKEITQEKSIEIARNSEMAKFQVLEMANGRKRRNCTYKCY